MRPERRRVLAPDSLPSPVRHSAPWLLAQPREKVIRIIARKFEFVPRRSSEEGRAGVLKFTTADVLMGFNAPDFKVRTDIAPGQVARVHVAPDKTGDFDFFCDNFCSGEGHETMSGTIRVTA